MEHWFEECARYAEPDVVKYLVSSETTYSERNMWLMKDLIGRE